MPTAARDPQSDAADPRSYAQFPETPGSDFIWAHPPYWRQKIYSDNPDDMSCAPTLDEFLKSYGIFIRESARLLAAGEKFAILMGDYSDRQAGFVPLTHYTKQLAFAAELEQACTDIIRFSHGASRNRKTYRSSLFQACTTCA
jgi:hypothetical protein